MWKNETDEVKDHFRAMADQRKKEHAMQYPDYQYTPRKPTEKLKRMTARKYREMQTKAEAESLNAGTVEQDSIASNPRDTYESVEATNNSPFQDIEIAPEVEFTKPEEQLFKANEDGTVDLTFPLTYTDEELADLLKSFTENDHANNGLLNPVDVNQQTANARAGVFDAGLALNRHEEVVETTHDLEQKIDWENLINDQAFVNGETMDDYVHDLVFDDTYAMDTMQLADAEINRMPVDLN